MTKPEYTWYIEPLDSDTNQTISRQLTESAEENFSPKIVCGDGKQRNLWRCSYEFALSFVRSKDSLELKFKVWGKTGRHGKITKKTFLFEPKWQKRKKQKLPPKGSFIFRDKKIRFKRIGS